MSPFLLSLALANEISAPCGPLSFVTTSPRDGATGVPTDVVLRVGVETCSDTEAVTLSLQSAEGSVLREETVEGPEDAAVLALDPGGLGQNTTYVLVASTASGAGLSASFTTGTGAVEGILGEPEILGIDADVRWDQGEIDGGWPVVTATDVDVLSIATLHLGDRMITVADVAASGEQVFMAWSETPDERPRELCVVPGQVGGDGAEVLGAEVCLPVRGCATGGAGSAASGLGLVLAVLAGGRRRAAGAVQA